MLRSRFQIALGDIKLLFEKKGKKVYSFTEIGEILEEQRGFWKLPGSMSTRNFLEALLDKTILKKIDFTFPSIYA